MSKADFIRDFLMFLNSKGVVQARRAYIDHGVHAGEEYLDAFIFKNGEEVSYKDICMYMNLLDSVS